MDILINGEATDLTWEAEKTLGEVIAGLNAWASSQGHQVTSILVNHKAADFWDPQLSIHEINNVELDTVPQEQAWLHEMNVVRGYIQRLVHTVQNSENDNLVAFQEDYPWISPLLSRLGADTSLPPWNDPVLLLERAKEWLQSFPDQNLQPHLVQLKDWGRLIQQGRDREAMEALQNLSQDLENLSRLDWGSEVWWKDLNAFLGEAAEALTRQDLVLVADLLEYEIVPRLESLTADSGKLNISL